MRPSLDETMMSIALVLAQRATCQKRKVGCVLTDRNGRIIGSGYNGVAHSLPHCTEHPCGGEDMPVGSDTCQAIHAELNALLNCQDVQKIKTCYVTCFPCNNCMKTLLNTSCENIVYIDTYTKYEKVLEQWIAAGGKAWSLMPGLSQTLL